MHTAAEAIQKQDNNANEKIATTKNHTLWKNRSICIQELREKRTSEKQSF